MMGAFSAAGDVRFLLDLQPGQLIAVHAGSPDLAAALAREPVTVTTVANAPWPMNAGTVDHAFVPAATDSGRLLAEASRVLKPGGTIVVGIRGRRLSLRGLQRLCARRDLQLLACYGVRDGLAQPTLLVPLASRAPTLFYFRHRYIPYSPRAALLRPLLTWLARVGPYPFLFSSLLLVCRR